MHEKARRGFLHEESHWLDAYVTCALEKQKVTLPSLLHNTAGRFSKQIKMWFVS